MTPGAARPAPAPPLRYGTAALYGFLRRFGHQHWIPHGRERLIRLFANPDAAIDHPFTVDFFGARYDGNLNNYIDWSVYFLGAYAPEELLALRDIADHLRSAGRRVVYYDIGGNVGQHVLFMAARSDAVCVFEPFGAVRARLERRIAANGCTNVQVFPVALGVVDEERPFHPPGPVNQGTGTLIADLADRTGDPAPVTVPVRRGDALVAAENLAPPAIVKIDVEGAETEVLDGLRRTVAAARPFMLIELIDATRRRLGDEAGLRRLLYDGAEIFEIRRHRTHFDYRVRPFDFATSAEILVTPPGALEGIAAFGARWRG